MSKRKLEFGLNAALPKNVKAAWGARLIYPDDLVWDRQSRIGAVKHVKPLIDWLNGGALHAMREQARDFHKNGFMSPRSSADIVLHEDERGIIVGNPNGSHGYLYVVAWLKEAK